jgi:hypothetical protein
MALCDRLSGVGRRLLRCGHRPEIADRMKTHGRRTMPRTGGRIPVWAKALRPFVAKVEFSPENVKLTIVA